MVKGFLEFFRIKLQKASFCLGDETSCINHIKVLLPFSVNVVSVEEESLKVLLIKLALSGNAFVMFC